jgi:hypothetical protein
MRVVDKDAGVVYEGDVALATPEMAKFVYAALAEVELEIGCGGDQDGLQISERDGLRTWRYSEPQGHFAWECVEGDAGRVSSCRVRVAFRDPQTGKDRAVNERVLVLGTYRRLHAAGSSRRSGACSWATAPTRAPMQAVSCCCSNCPACCSGTRAFRMLLRYRHEGSMHHMLIHKEHKAVMK